MQSVIPRLMVDNFDFIPLTKKLLFQMQVFETFGRVSNSECSQRIQKCKSSTEGPKETRIIFSSLISGEFDHHKMQ